MNEITTDRTPEIIAVEIKSLEAQGTAMFLSVVAEIGKRLIEVKAMLPHGEWGKWLESGVNYSQDTATNYMKIAQEYNSVNSEPVRNLKFTQALALLTIPSTQREKFVQENDVENMSKRELQKAIKEAKIADKRAKEAEAKTTEIETEYKHMKENLHQMIQEKMSVDNKNCLLEDEMQSVKIALKHAQLDHKELLDKIKEQERLLAENNNEDAISRGNALQFELNKSNEKIAELTKKLNAPVTVETTIVEKIPEATVQELEHLRAENERLKSAPPSTDKSVLKYRICFESVKTNFNQLLQALAEIDDTDIKEKYKNATGKLLTVMGTKI